MIPALLALVPGGVRRAIAAARDRLTATLVDVREGLAAWQFVRALRPVACFGCGRPLGQHSREEKDVCLVAIRKRWARDPAALDPDEAALFAELRKAKGRQTRGGRA